MTWADGAPVFKAHLSLYDGNRYIRMIKLDDKNRFSFQVYGDFKYAVEASQWGERRGGSDRVAITDKSTNLTLVLKPR